LYGGVTGDDEDDPPDYEAQARISRRAELVSSALLVSAFFVWALLNG
jgi:hypothetical protein